MCPLGWSEDLVNEAWSQDRQEACEKAGLDLNAVQLTGTDYECSTAAMSLSTKEVISDITICRLTMHAVNIPIKYKSTSQYT